MLSKVGLGKQASYLTAKSPLVTFFGPGQTLRQAAKIYKSATKNDQKCIDAFQLENSAF